MVLIFRRGRLARGAKRGDRLRRRGRGRGNLLHQTHGARARNSARCDHNGTWCAAVQASTPRAFSKVVVQSARLSVYLHLGHIAERVVDAFPPLDMGEESVAIIEESSLAGDAKRLSLDGSSAQSLDDASGLSRSAAPDEASDSPAARAEALIDDDRLLEAARVCRDAGLSTPLDIPGADFPVERETVRKVNHYLPKAARMHALLDSLKSDPNAPDTEWLVQGEHMGRRDVSIYYHVDPETSSKLTARIESPISRDMLVPLLSVLNESELYKTWVPNWTVPRLRMRRSDKLHQHGRCSQVVLVTMDLPWPFSSREAVLDACGVDDIDAAGDICVLVESLDAERDGSEHRDGSAEFIVPRVDEADTVRIDFEGGFLFRALPRGWREARRAIPAAKKPSSSSWFSGGWGESAVANPADDADAAPATSPDGTPCDDERDAAPDVDGDDADAILVSVQMYIDPKISFVPASLMHFVTRTVLYTMWCVLLRMAEGIRDGKAPAHAAAIEAKRETLYDWTVEGVRLCLEGVRAGGGGGGGVAVVHHRLFQRELWRDVYVLFSLSRW